MTKSILNPNEPIRVQMEKLIRAKQIEITNGLETLETNKTIKFQTDEWLRGNNGGGGKSMVIQNGEVYEKGGVNISVVHGELTPGAIQSMKSNHKNINFNNNENVKFFACGLSMVIHPVNPYSPTTHLNYRYFEINNEGEEQGEGEPKVWWFGGGADLTPSYINESDCKLFHQTHKDALNKFNSNYYSNFKKWCDEYFFIPHRGESRGIGGIFFDDFDELPAQQCLEMIESCLDAFLPSYLPIIERTRFLKFGQDEKKWQLIRRGRYVEFNLVYDRGTKFGLQTPGSRIESILMSLPVNASWLYDYQPEQGSEEEKLLKICQKPIEWV